MVSAKKVMIIAGESSGDLYGAHVVQAVTSMSPQVEFSGVGGDEMEASAVNILCSASELAVVGITEVLEKMVPIWKAWRILKHFIITQKPDLAILIDFPDFNLRMAKFLKAKMVPVLYYVSPQVWAWRSGRIKTIAKRVNKMAVILPFEKSLYQEHGVDAEFVGHPLLELLNKDLTRKEARQKLRVPLNSLLIGLLPGSREREIRVLLPHLVGAAGILGNKFPKCRFVIPLASAINREVVQDLALECQHDIEIVEGRAFEVMKAADILLMASGTATLEGAIAGTPMVIVYKVSPLSALIARMLIKVNCIGLANLIVGKKLVPELLQKQVNAQRIALEAEAILNDSEKIKEIRSEFARITDNLGGLGASQRVAKIALQMMEAA